MQDIAELTEEQAVALSHALNRAVLHGNRVRIMTGTDNDGFTYIKWAIGGYMWTPAQFGQDYIDACREQEPVPPRLTVGPNGEPVISL